jgi:exonuclease SbcC
MRINSIHCRDFLSFQQVDLDLSTVSSVVFVGKVGSGKSGLAFDATTFALYGESRYSTLDRAIRRGADTCVVRLEFESNGIDYVVERTRRRRQRTSLALYRNGDLMSRSEGDADSTHHTLKQTQSVINRIVGLDYSAVLAGPFMMQNKSDYLTSLKSSDAINIFLSLVGLDIYEKPQSMAADRAKAALAVAQELGQQAEQIEALVAEESDAKSELITAQAEMAVATAVREEIAGKISDVKARIAELRERANHVKTLRDSVASLADRIKSDTAARDKLVSQLSDAHSVAGSARPTSATATSGPSQEDIDAARAASESEQTLRQELAAVRARVASETATLTGMTDRAKWLQQVPCGGEGIYATCMFIATAPSKKQLAEQTKRVSDLNSDVARITARINGAGTRYEAILATSRAASAERATREAQVATWQTRVENAKQLVESGNDTLRRLSTQIERDKSHLSRLAAQLNTTSADDSDMDAAVNEQRSLEAQFDERRQTIELLYAPAVQEKTARVNQIVAAKETLPGIDRKYREKQAEANTYKVLAQAFHRNGIPRLILDSAIPSIEDTANRILSRMPDGYVLHVKTRREKVKGGTTDDLDIQVTINGEDQPYEGLSGGEKFRVDFALRIALSELVARRGGASVKTLILDEMDRGGQDSEGIEALTDALSSVMVDFGLVIAISHIPEIIEKFPAEVRVEKRNGISTAVLLS